MILSTKWAQKLWDEQTHENRPAIVGRLVQEKNHQLGIEDRANGHPKLHHHPAYHDGYDHGEL